LTLCTYQCLEEDNLVAIESQVWIPILGGNPFGS